MLCGQCWLAKQMLIHGIIMVDTKKLRSSQPSEQNGECLIRAAQYLRMSKGLQTCSVQNQRAVIQQYAQLNGFGIVHTYCDEGRSGLDLAHRPGLKRLIDDVLTHKADFSVILVLDVSRWGRFQDPDESAHYEFLCKVAGVPVRYCAECFTSDNSPRASLMKSLKRIVAAEYAREMSKRVFAGQSTLATNGYSTGGPVGYGLRRLLLDSCNRPKRILARGEQKRLTTDRIKLVPGPSREVRVVRRIYSMFLEGNLNDTVIARRLNRSKIAREGYERWTNFAVHTILTNPKYKGCVVFNGASQKLRSKRQPNPPDHWIIRPNGMEPVVSASQFQRVQEQIKRQVVNRANDELLDELRSLLRSHGRISVKLISEAEGLASWVTYRNRFGSLRRAYELVGYSMSKGLARHKPNIR